MIQKEISEMLSFIDGNPTAFHTTASIRDILLHDGFTELLESKKWELEPGEGYFVCRNGSSIIAFRMGTQLENYSFLAFWVMSMKPPGPTTRPWKLWAFTLPNRSTSAKPSTAMSRAPPS